MNLLQVHELELKLNLAVPEAGLKLSAKKARSAKTALENQPTNKETNFYRTAHEQLKFVQGQFCVLLYCRPVLLNNIVQIVLESFFNSDHEDNSPNEEN